MSKHLGDVAQLGLTLLQKHVIFLLCLLIFFLYNANPNIVVVFLHRPFHLGYTGSAQCYDYMLTNIRQVYWFCLGKEEEDVLSVPIG